MFARYRILWIVGQLKYAKGSKNQIQKGTLIFTFYLMHTIIHILPDNIFIYFQNHLCSNHFWIWILTKKNYEFLKMCCRRSRTRRKEARKWYGTVLLRTIAVSPGSRKQSNDQKHKRDTLSLITKRSSTRILA
jgi:hypothetical protein